MIIKNSGFTLIELLVVFGIMVFIGGITADLFVGIIKGNNKAGVINEIKQNGNYAISFMDRVIRNSSALILYEDKKIVIQDQEEGKCVRFRMIPAVDGATNGYITVTEVNVCDYGPDGDFDESATFYDAAAEKTLTNTNVNSGVSLTEGRFVVNTESGQPSTVSISFTLSQGEMAQSRNDYQASEIFKTLVSLRTY